MTWLLVSYGYLVVIFLYCALKIMGPCFELLTFLLILAYGANIVFNCVIFMLSFLYAFIYPLQQRYILFACLPFLLWLSLCYRASYIFISWFSFINRRCLLSTYGFCTYTTLLKLFGVDSSTSCLLLIWCFGKINFGDFSEVFGSELPIFLLHIDIYSFIFKMGHIWLFSTHSLLL